MPNLNTLANHLTAALPPAWDLNKDINEVMDVDSRETALSFACSTNNLPLVTALLQAGANPNILSGDGVTPKWRAQDFGLTEIELLLTQHGGKVLTDNHFDRGAFSAFNDFLGLPLSVNEP